MQMDNSARDARLEAVHQRLEAAVGNLVTGDDWKRAMTFAAQFRSRSFNNTVLIWAQHAHAHEQGRVPDPTPTYVAGFKQWLSLGRAVMRGQSGYAILAPVSARYASPTPTNAESWRRLASGEKPKWGETVRSKLVGVRPTYVWDVSQTSGDPLPELPRPVLLQGEAPAGLWDGLADQITGAGYELRLVSNAAAIGGANGLTDFVSRAVSIRVDMDDSAQAKTLAHELGHVLLHAPGDAGEGGLMAVAADAATHRGIAEVEAESVALMIGAAHGLDTTSYTVPYVSTWASSVEGKSPVEVIQATAERVRSAAIGVLDKLETPKVGDGNPPGLDREALAAQHRRSGVQTAARRHVEAMGL